MRTALLITLLFAISACGKDNQGAAASTSALGVNGLSGAVYTQQNGFQDVQICGVDVHVVGGKVKVCGGSAYSQTDDSGYILASDGLFQVSNAKYASCYFYVTNGVLSNQ